MYACATCFGAGELAGVCLACSLHCHDGHQLYELYTKRWEPCWISCQGVAGPDHCKRHRVGQNPLDTAEGSVQRREVLISLREARKFFSPSFFRYQDR